MLRLYLLSGSLARLSWGLENLREEKSPPKAAKKRPISISEAESYGFFLASLIWQGPESGNRRLKCSLSGGLSSRPGACPGASCTSPWSLFLLQGGKVRSSLFSDTNLEAKLYLLLILGVYFPQKSLQHGEKGAVFKKK